MRVHTRQRIRLKGILIAVLAILLLAVVGIWSNDRHRQSCSTFESIEARAEEAYKFAKTKGLSLEKAFFVDYSIPSGTPRLFVWDFKEKRIVARTYVMHGSGGGSTAEKPCFSNEVGSGCSSLGRFKVTKSHVYHLKRSFLMVGYDKTNSNALKRGIMIHRSTWVDIKHRKKYIPLHSDSCRGCITVGTRGMKYLEKTIKADPKPILLWSYE